MSESRPLTPDRTPRVGLADTDLVYFLHIPRTGGTTLHELLAAQFPADRVLKGRSRREFPPLLAEMGADRVARLRFVSAHYDTNAAALLDRPLRFVTMLRDPIARTMSQYEIIKRMPKHFLHDAVESGAMSFLDWLLDPRGGEVERDRQVRQVSGTMDGDPGGAGAGASPDIQSRIACERLEDFAFFGIHERFTESIEALHRTFGWDPPADVPRLNPTPVENHRGRLTTPERDAVEALTRLDARLYRYARRLFRRRY